MTPYYRIALDTGEDIIVPVPALIGASTVSVAGALKDMLASSEFIQVTNNHGNQVVVLIGRIMYVEIVVQ